MDEVRHVEVRRWKGATAHEWPHLSDAQPLVGVDLGTSHGLGARGTLAATGSRQAECQSRVVRYYEYSSKCAVPLGTYSYVNDNLR